MLMVARERRERRARGVYCGERCLDRCVRQGGALIQTQICHTAILELLASEQMLQVAAGCMDWHAPSSKQTDRHAQPEVMPLEAGGCREACCEGWYTALHAYNEGMRMNDTASCSVERRHTPQQRQAHVMLLTRHHTASSPQRTSLPEWLVGAVASPSPSGDAMSCV
jgi:hypothetical protein